jgi:hypothetical protein
VKFGRMTVQKAPAGIFRGCMFSAPCLAFGTSVGSGRFRAMTVLELLVDEKFFDGCYFFLH